MKKKITLLPDIHSFHFKLFLGINAAIYICYLLSSSLFLYNIYTSTLTQTLASSSAYAERVTSLIEAETQNIRFHADTVTLDPDITTIFCRNNDGLYENIGLWREDCTMIADQIAESYLNSDISSMQIITANNFVKQYPSSKFYDLQRFAGSPWYQQIHDNNSSFVFHLSKDFASVLNLSDSYIYFTRNLPIQYPDYATYFVGGVDRTVFDHLISMDNGVPYSYGCLLNDNGDFITDVPEQYQDIFLSIDQNQYSSLNFTLEKNEIQNDTYYATRIDIANTDLKFIYLLDYHEMLVQTLFSSVRTMLLILLMILPFSLVISYWLSHSLSKRIGALKDNMILASEGDFDLPILAGNGEDEISILNRNFNYMLTKISQLVDEQYQNGKRIKELELISLQAQINPHFLYNTLDLIKWKAIRNHDPETEELINALSSYYRLSLSKGKEMVTLASELDHIRSYVFIQNKRFDDSVTLDIDIAPKYLACPLPKLILQPIVENAILHGILELPEQVGTITIRARETDFFFELSIHDDGVGIPPDALNSAESDDDPKDDSIPSIIRTGYGLNNVNNRLELAFGSRYGITIPATTDRGTTICLNLPLQYAQGEMNHV